MKMQISLTVYKLFESNCGETLIIDLEMPGIISPVDYEKAGLEELAL